MPVIRPGISPLPLRRFRVAFIACSSPSTFKRPCVPAAVAAAAGSPAASLTAVATEEVVFWICSILLLMTPPSEARG